MRFIGWERKDNMAKKHRSACPKRAGERCLAALVRRSHVAFCPCGPMREATLFAAPGGTFEPPAVKVGKILVIASAAKQSYLFGHRFRAIASLRLQ
jgi:hypothetical protein